MKKTLLTVLVSAAAIVAGCKSHEKTNVGQVIELPANSLCATWTRSLKMNGEPQKMRIQDDSLFLTTSENEVYRLNRNSGALTYIIDTIPKGARVSAPLITSDGVVIAADTKLYIFDGRGFLTKEIDTKRPLRSGLASDKNGLYVGTDAEDGTGRLVCIEVDKPFSPYRWQLMTGGLVASTPATYNGIVYAGGDDGRVYAVDPDRAAAWAIGTFKTDRAIRARISAEASGVYVASIDSKLYCLDPADGKIRWQYYGGMYLIDGPDVTATTVYLNVRDQGLVAIDKKEGEYIRKAKWVCPKAKGFLAEDAKYAMLRGVDDTILVVDKATGVVKFTSGRKDIVAFAVNTVDGTAYAATRSGKVMAVVPIGKPGTVGELVFLESSEAKLASGL